MIKPKNNPENPVGFFVTQKTQANPENPSEPVSGRVNVNANVFKRKNPNQRKEFDYNSILDIRGFLESWKFSKP